MWVNLCAVYVQMFVHRQGIGWWCLRKLRYYAKYTYLFIITACPPVDVCLVIDTSDSISRRNLNTVFEFLGEFGSKLNVGSSVEQILVAAVTFGRNCENPFSFYNYTDNTSLANALRNLDRVVDSRGTKTSLGLNKCRELTGRNNSDRCIIVLTDGTSNEGDTLTAAINETATDNIKVAAIGLIKDGTSQQRLKDINKQLIEIALGNQENVFATSFSDLNDIIGDVVQKVQTCP